MVCMVLCKLTQTYKYHMYCQVLFGRHHIESPCGQRKKETGVGVKTSLVVAAIPASNPSCLFGLLPRKNRKGGRVKTYVGCGSYTCLKPTSLFRLLARQKQKGRESEKLCWLWQLCWPQTHHFLLVCSLRGLMSQSPCEIH